MVFWWSRVLKNLKILNKWLTKKIFQYNIELLEREIFKFGLKVGENMSTVKVGENESLESALKRFKRKCQKDGIIGDLRKKEAYVKPSVAKKVKKENAIKRNNKKGR